MKKLSIIYLSIIYFIVISLFGYNNTYADNTNIVNSDSIYTSDYGDLCRLTLEAQFTKGVNPIKPKTKKMVDDIIPQLDTKYTDEKLLAVNKKIVSIISKLNKTSLKFNTYGYLMVKIDTILDKKITSDVNYIKTECALLLKPLNLKYTSGANYQLELLKRKKEANNFLKGIVSNDNVDNIIQLNINDENNSNININNTNNTNNTNNKTENLLYTLSPTELVDKYFTDPGRKTTIDFWKGKLEINKINSIEFDKRPFYAVNIYAIPIDITSKVRNKKYDLDMNSLEFKKIKEYEQKYLQLRIDILTLKKQSLYLSGKEAVQIIDKVDILEKEYKQNAMNYVLSVKKIWEQNSYCIRKANNGMYMLYGKDIMQQIGYGNIKEQEELEKQYSLSAFFGNDMLCDYYMLYPELNKKTTELEKMNLSELESLYNNDSFIPTLENSKNIAIFIWDTNVKTTLDQANWVYKWAKQAKKYQYLPYIAKLKGISEDTLIRLIDIKENDVYSIMK